MRIRQIYFCVMQKLGDHFNMKNEAEIREALTHELETRGAQTRISQAIGVNGSTVMRWSTGEVTIPAAMQKLLALYLFGEIPFSMLRDPEAGRSLLEFSEEEWRLITILAARAGQEPKAWIRSQILAYLAYYKEQATGSDEAPNPLQSLPRAAEDGAPYGPTKKAAG
jgi:hypothetical protein